MAANDKAIDDKKRRLAELKLAKERLEAELASAEEEVATAGSAAKPVRKVPRRAASKSSAERSATRTLSNDVAEEESPAQKSPQARRRNSNVERSADQPARQEAERRRPRAKQDAVAEHEPAETDSSPDDDAEDSTAHEEREPLQLWRKLRGAPPWMISLILHAVLFVFLALATFVGLQEDEKVVSITSVTTEEIEAVDPVTEVAMEQLEMEEVEELSIETPLPDPGQINLGEVLATSDAVPISDVGSIAMSTDIGEIGALLGKEGKGLADAGEGMYASVSFFGSKSQGRRFVFVVDNSNSMGAGRYETALDEMMKSVNALGPKQQFYVIFFSDMAYRMFHPKPAERAVAATSENKERLRFWLYNTEMCLRTNGLDAMKAAIELRPDVIYILGDGAFGDKTGAFLTATHNRDIVINTLGMEVNDRGKKELAAIAKANEGTYKDVIPSPLMKKYAKENPINKNRVRGEIWGLKLPKAK